MNHTTDVFAVRRKDGMKWFWVASFRFKEDADKFIARPGKKIKAQYKDLQTMRCEVI